MYLDFFKNVGEIQTEEEFFIIIELAHWLANRDGGGYDISKAHRPKLAKGFDTALKLLNNLEKNLEKFNNLKGDFYATRGVISFNSTSYKSAIDDFEKAMTFGNESIELKYNLASAYFLNGKYDKAIELYEEVANSQNKKINPNILNRDLGFAYLLRCYEKYRINNTSDAKLLFNKSKTAFDAIIQTEFSKHHDIAIAGKATAIYLYEKDDSKEKAYWDAREKLMPIINTNIAKETKRIFGDLDDRIGLSRLIGLKKGIAGTYITHDEIATKKGDLFEIFHDNFYCPSDAMRKNHRSN
ncbi:M48 family metallopeptidase [Okeania sp. SIO1I7]|uniref:tetratricopeptide repeat protein n=1 Tax=Okeania sp. SIO1I7 TaxID=2607772 RepID=UPI0013F7C10F|nr:tetratricopeptide repeat protein [Okeania sp. SIO1I7]NET25521.1 tetratricopeptide repeat protein [Okeania sp. SIO1I7]